jgi:hypothetical protein
MADDTSNDRSADEEAIRELLDRQAMAWAAGDPEGYALPSLQSQHPPRHTSANRPCARTCPGSHHRRRNRFPPLQSVCLAR